jgi:hypothetical protein
LAHDLVWLCVRPVITVEAYVCTHLDTPAGYEHGCHLLPERQGAATDLQQSAILTKHLYTTPKTDRRVEMGIGREVEPSRRDGINVDFDLRLVEAKRRNPLPFDGIIRVWESNIPVGESRWRSWD